MTDQARVIARESGGNPFFVTELVRHISVGAELSDAFGGAVRSLSTKCCGTGSCVCRAGRDASSRPLRCPASRFARTPPAEWRVSARMGSTRWRCCAGHLVRSAGPGSLDDVEVYHDRIRETVIKHLSPEVLKTWHGELARELEDAGGADSETLAVHFEAAERPEMAGQILRGGCRQCRQGPGVRPRGQALSTGPRALADSGEAGRSLRVELGDALANAGRGVEAARSLPRRGHKGRRG